MPVYEYQCQTCQLVFEARQKFSDAPLTACTSCGGSVKKLISQTGFALKGSGWYQQGYTEKAAKPGACASAETGGGCAGCPKAANG
jgi:putative FmdB family regulatory protein